MTQFGDDLYEKLDPFHADDAVNDNALQTYGNALAEMFAPVEMYAREQNGTPGWAPLVTPSLAPEDQALRWMAQLAGVRLDVGLDTATMQAQLTQAEGRRRGTPAYLRQVAQRYLTGAQLVIINERNPDAYSFQVMTRTAETPNPAAVSAALAAAKPAGLVLNYSVVVGVTWDESTHTWDAATITWDQSTSTAP